MNRCMQNGCDFFKVYFKIVEIRLHQNYSKVLHT